MIWKKFPYQTNEMGYDLSNGVLKIIISLRRKRRVLFLDLSILFLLFFFISISSLHFFKIFEKLYSKNY